MTNPAVTIVVVPRERFSMTQRNLESIYRNTSIPFNLVYISGGTPSPVRAYLERESERRNFRLVCTPHYLTPNEARNLSLPEVHTPYVVFSRQ